MQPSKQEHRYQELAVKWLNGTITPEEEKEFADWFNAGSDEPILVPDTFAASEEAHRQRILDKIRQSIGAAPKKPVRLRQWAVAASIALVACTAAVYFIWPAP